MVELEQLTLRRGRRIVIDKLTFHLARGEILAVLGPNGAGKSSLLKGILGLLPASGGCICIGGRALETLSPEARAKMMAYVPQASALHVAWSVRDVVRMGRFALRYGRAQCPDDFIVEQAMGQMDVLGQSERSFLSLSGGERGRVLIARALATEAPLLLLDEPTRCLDTAHAIDCMQHLERLRGMGKTIVVVTHDLNEIARVADQALLLEAGRLRACAAPRQLFKSRIMREVFGVELVPNVAYGFVRSSDAGEGMRG
jgi:iron complex transport system ATP-binding protein